MTIKRVGPASCAKIAGVLYAALGLLIGALISCFSLVGMALPNNSQTTQSPLPPAVAGAIGVGAIIACPIFYGIIGYVSAWIGAWLYNLVASKVGGIEIDISAA